MKKICSIMLVLLIAKGSFAQEDTSSTKRWKISGYGLSSISPYFTISFSSYQKMRSLCPNSAVLALGDVQAGDVTDRSTYFMTGMNVGEAGLLISPVAPQNFFRKHSEFYFGIGGMVNEERNMAMSSRTIKQTYTTGHFTGQNAYYQPADSVSYYFWGNSIRSNSLELFFQYRFYALETNRRFNIVIAPYLGGGITTSSYFDLYYYHSIYATQPDGGTYLIDSEIKLNNDTIAYKLPVGGLIRAGGYSELLFKAGKKRTPPDGLFIGWSFGMVFNSYFVSGQAFPSVALTNKFVFLYRFGPKNRSPKKN